MVVVMATDAWVPVTYGWHHHWIQRLASDANSYHIHLSVCSKLLLTLYLTVLM